jgi:hypothetical protein
VPICPDTMPIWHPNKENIRIRKEDDEASRVEDRSRLRGLTFTELLARRGMGSASAPKAATGPILASLALGPCKRRR